MAKEKKDKHFIHKPTYEGGAKAMKKFISKHLKYPKKALENKIEGTVYLKYTINHKGKVIETKVISSLGKDCDQEAIRLVKMLKFQVSKTRGVKVKFFKNIQIHFRLPKEKTKPVQSFQYIYTSNPKEKKAIEPIKENGNSYVITIKY